MKLLIAIPALNEEGSIESIISQTLDARHYITANSPVSSVAITVISDGSTDRTVELASQFADHIDLIVFAENRGYGAAIKEAWARSDAELLGFLDADGTCDPRFFAELCQALHERRADVVLGSRMHPRARMPLIRRLGNSVFSSLLTVISRERVRDTASGMRVVRRDCLVRLYPLPDGLHFTPAMSARCLLSDDVPICEVEMPYHERSGRSKLSVVRDGLRFLRVILTTASLYRSERLFNLAGCVLFLTASALMIRPVLYYVQTRTVAEWMIYRFVVSQLLGTASVLLFCMSYVVGMVVAISLTPRSLTARLLSPGSLFPRFLESRFFWLLPTALVTAGGILVYPSFHELVLTGATYEHWSRFVVMSFFMIAAIILLVTRAAGFALHLLADRVVYLSDISTEESVSRGETFPARQ